MQGILMKPYLHQATIEGRKTQTRRVIVPQPEQITVMGTDCWRWNTAIYGWIDGEGFRKRLAFYAKHKTGDVAYVKEGLVKWEKTGIAVYKSDNVAVVLKNGYGENEFIDWNWKRDYLSPLHLPAKAARTFIKFTDVRVERLKEISNVDCHNEGLKSLSKDNGRTYKFGIPDSDGLPGNDDYGWHWSEWCTQQRAAFRKLWDSINTDRGFAWDSDPWCWVYVYELITREEAFEVEAKTLSKS